MRENLSLWPDSLLDFESLLVPSSEMSKCTCRSGLFVWYSAIVANYFDEPCELLSRLADFFLPRAENYLLYNIGFFMT